jgi:hypothetical protein
MSSDNYRFQDDTRPISPEKADEAAKAREEHACDGPHLGEPPRVRARESKAAGIPAIANTMKYGFGEMGPAESVRVFLAMNKVNGFDCQSCAWPSPDPPHRKIAEFCENGAKAASDELSHRRVDPSFFERFSVAKLLEQSDHWLNSQGAPARHERPARLLEHVP